MTEMTLEQIDAEIVRLYNLKVQKRQEDIDAFKKRATQNIGRCFRVNEMYAIVVDIPREEPTLHGSKFNRYLYPALYIQFNKGSDEISQNEHPIMPFCVDTLPSAAWGEGYNSSNTKYEEISPDEFYSYFCEAMHQFRLGIKDIIEARKEGLSNE